MVIAVGMWYVVCGMENFVDCCCTGENCERGCDIASRGF